MDTKNIKGILDSYLRNLLGVVLALVTTTMANSGLASPLDFGSGEWLTVANGLWAAAVPTLLRYINKQDPAFGLVAEVAAKEVSKKLSEAAKKTSKKAPAAPKKAAGGGSGSAKYTKK
jgi:type IV secretory pathway TrbD component